MNVTTSDDRPPFRQLADLLRDEIRAGRYQPDERLPTQREMASRYKVAPMTVQAALRVLRSEGLIASQQGKGTFVRASGASAEEPPTLSDVAEQVEEVRANLTELAEAVRPGAVDELREEIADLRRFVNQLQAQLIDLYGRTGQPFPHGAADAGKGTSRRKTG